MADLGNEFTIKRLHKFPDGRIELHSENSSGDYPNFSPKEGRYLGNCRCIALYYQRL